MENAADMSATPEHLLMILALAALTYLSRLSGFLIGTRQAPPAVAQALHYVPIAAFAALIVPGLVVPGEVVPRLIAAICTGVVALRIGKLWAALRVGMALFWGMRVLGV